MILFLKIILIFILKNIQKNKKTMIIFTYLSKRNYLYFR